jgi:NAD kinase
MVLAIALFGAVLIVVCLLLLPTDCQILWYSRRNPHTGEISPFFRWKRSVCPWDLKRSSNEWEPISRVEHTNESLAAHVNRVKRIYGHEKSHRATELEKESPNEPRALPAKPRPATPAVSDPLIHAELQSLKRDVPVLAAAAHAAAEEVRPMVAGHDDDSSSDRRKGSLLSPPAAGTPPTVGGAAAAAADGQTAPASPPPAPAPVVWNPPPGWPFLSAHPRVLVLTKTPRYEHEKNSSGLRGQDLHAELSKLGFVSDRLVQSYVRHMEGLGQLTQALQAHAMKVIVKHVDSANRSDLEGIDLILSAGGDGTMLKAAALLGFQQRTTTDAPAACENRGAVPAKLGAAQHHPAASGDSIDSSTATFGADVAPPADPAANAAAIHSQHPMHGEHPSENEPYVPIPLIGVNTDPQHSSGVLCAFSIEGPHTAERVIEHLRKSHFVWLDKSRIEITLLDKSGAVTLVPQYAYNDVVVAERDPGRPIVYELTVDDHPAEIQRSSGVLVCTGTGSTAWMSNAAAIHPDQVSAVLNGRSHTAMRAAVHRQTI